MVSLAGHVATDHLLTLIKVPVLILGWTKRIVTVLWRAVFVKNETSNLSLTVVACIWEKVRSFIRTEGREEMMLLQVSAVVIFCYHWYVLNVWGPFVRKQWRWLHERFYTLQLPAKQVAAFVFLFSFSFYQIKLKQRKKKPQQLMIRGKRIVCEIPLEGAKSWIDLPYLYSSKCPLQLISLSCFSPVPYCCGSQSVWHCDIPPVSPPQLNPHMGRW